MKNTSKKKTPTVKEDIWELHPIKYSKTIVRLPIFSEEYKKMESITFNKSESTFSIVEFKTTGLISGTCGLNLDGGYYIINMSYPQLVHILFG